MSKTFKSLALACIAMFAGIMSYAQVTTSALSGKILSVDHVDDTGVPYFKTSVPAGAKTWDYNHSIGQCWYLQVGLRYMFN